jgi:hypothetical protein
MKKELEKFINLLQPLIDGFNRYRITIFIVFFIGIYTFLVFRISSLTNREPDPAALSDRLQTVQRLRIDQNSIDRILELEEQNIDVRALFEQARNNPFNE